MVGCDTQHSPPCARLEELAVGGSVPRGGCGVAVLAVQALPEPAAEMEKKKKGRENPRKIISMHLSERLPEAGEATINTG